MGFLENMAKKRDFRNANTPLQKLFVEAKWNAIENDTTDLEVYNGVQKMMDEAIQKYGYTEKGKKECETIIKSSHRVFEDERFYEFLIRGLNGER